jgi:hypothetical protein
MHGNPWFDVEPPLLHFIELPARIPSYWEYTMYHWARRRKLQDEYAVILRTVSPAKHMIPFKGFVQVGFIVYKHEVRGDAHNLVAPFDKMVLDNITTPKGNKTRGLGWIIDDSPKYMELLPPQIRLTKGKERTLVWFYQGVQRYDEEKVMKLKPGPKLGRPKVVPKKKRVRK